MGFVRSKVDKCVYNDIYYFNAILEPPHQSEVERMSIAALKGGEQGISMDENILGREMVVGAS